MQQGSYLHDDEILGKAFDIKITKRLLRFLKPYWGLFVICVGLTLVLGAVQLSIPYLAKIEIDSYLTLPRAIVALPKAPDVGHPIEVAEGRYLVEVNDVDPRVLRSWKDNDQLESERYLFISDDREIRALISQHSDLFSRVEGGYIVASDSLERLPNAKIRRIRGNAIRGVMLVAGILAGALLLRFVVGVLQVYLLQYTGQKVMYDMRRTIFNHILRLPLRFFDLTPVGRLVTRTTNDVQAINEMFTSMLVNLFRDGFLLIGIAIVMLQMNWRMAMMVIVLFPPILFAALQFRNRVRVAYRDVRKQIAKLNAYLQESISGIRIIQVFVQEAEANKRFSKINDDKYRANMRQMLTYAVFRPLMSFLSSFAIALVVWYGGRSVLGGSLSLGALTAFIHYVRMLFDPILRLSEGYNVLQAAMASSERIFLLLDEEQENRGAGATIEKFEGRIEFRNVWFAYDDDWVLKDVSFVVQPGERVAVVGPTGSGKTTIIRLLLRMYPIQKGQILLDGVPVEDLDLGYLRSRMAVVLQDVFLFSGSVLDNIRLRSDIPEGEVVEAARFANADFVEDLPDGYKADVKERGAALSIGERQLLAFARAVAFEPKILVLDEATASVDSHTEKLVQQSLHRIMEGRTSIVIAHRLSTIRQADKILVVNRGRVVEEGTHDELIAVNGLYAALHQVQFAQEPG